MLLAAPLAVLRLEAGQRRALRICCPSRLRVWRLASAKAGRTMMIAPIMTGFQITGCSVGDDPAREGFSQFSRIEDNAHAGVYSRW